MNHLPAAADSYQRLRENALQQILRRLEHQKKWSPKRWQPTCDVDAAAAGGKLFTSLWCIIYLTVSPSVDDALSIVCPSVYTAYVSVSSLVHQSMMHHLPASPSVYNALSTNQFISPCCIIYQLCHQSVMHYLLVGPSILRNIFNMQYLVTPVFTSPRQSSTFKSTY